MVQIPQPINGCAGNGETPVRFFARLFVRCVRNRKTMNGQGRVIVRYSGTEPKLRILVEGKEISAVNRVMQEVEALYKQKTEACK